MKTYSTKLNDVKRVSHTLDAADQILGRLATRAATLLMGKDKTVFSRSMDTGDFVTIINAEKVKVTGNKISQKMYYRHSGYPGGFKPTNYEKMMEEHPERIIEAAVKGMLPTNRLRARMMKRLRIFPGEAPVQAKAPVAAAEEEKKG
ncbi:MAG: 50S ribosomal protein L13 [Dehalococcoidales bacterium]|nr:50S ribosomal protein L13 [Dehalococcoidales bacterium]